MCVLQSGAGNINTDCFTVINHTMASVFHTVIPYTAGVVSFGSSWAWNMGFCRNEPYKPPYPLRVITVDKLSCTLMSSMGLNFARWLCVYVRAHRVALSRTWTRKSPSVSRRNPNFSTGYVCTSFILAKCNFVRIKQHTLMVINHRCRIAVSSVYRNKFADRLQSRKEL